MQGAGASSGQAELELDNRRSRLSTLDRWAATACTCDGRRRRRRRPTLTLSTLDGALQLSGSGQWTGAQLRFRGEARAAPGSEAALDNLLNIIGRRQGALSVISIG